MASLGHESESEHLERLIDSIPSLIHTASPDGYLDYFNQRWLQYVGLPIEDLLGWKWTAVIHPEDVGAIVEKWHFSIANGEPFLHEARVRRADGEYRWMLHHKVAVRDEFGQIVKWYGSSIDIEDRKQAEEQLRRSAQELQRSAFYLAEAQRLGHMGGWVFDPTKGFDYWSHELFQIHGLDPAAEAPSSEQYLALVHLQDRESMASLMKRMPLDVSGFDVTKRIVRSNGEVRYVRCVGSPPFDDGISEENRYWYRCYGARTLDSGAPTARGLSGRSPMVRLVERLRSAGQVQGRANVRATGKACGLRKFRFL